MVVCVLAPRWFDVFVPVERRDDGVRKEAPGVTEGLVEVEVARGMESGSGSGSGDERRLSEEMGKSGKA